MLWPRLWPVAVVAVVAVADTRLDETTTTRLVLLAPHKVLMDRARAVATAPEEVVEVAAKMAVLAELSPTVTTVLILEKMAIV
jgi:hypothetical protein